MRKFLLTADYVWLVVPGGKRCYGCGAKGWDGPGKQLAMRILGVQNDWEKLKVFLCRECAAKVDQA